MTRLRELPLACLAIVLLSCDGGEGSNPPPLVESGLDARPSNTACIAPPRATNGIVISAPRAFPNLTFASPVAMIQPPGDDSRWFLVEQDGLVRSFENNAAAAASLVVLDLRSRVDFGDEQGLLGLAIHPEFAANGRAFVNYIQSTGGVRWSVTSEFSSPDGGLTLDPGSERELLRVVEPFANHNGGNLAFGPDGFLYLGLGDGGGDGDPDESAQNLQSLLGKIIRIDVDQQPDGAPYAIPADNPHAGNALCNADGSGTQPCPEVYAAGFRSPWRWSFDRQTGELWLGDIGQTAFEEIDIVERGRNYGWDIREGAHCFEPANGCATAGLTDPVAEYGRDLGFSITGGYVYRGSEAPSLAGRYVFADFGGMIGTLAPNGAGGHTVEPLVQPGATPHGAPGPLQVSSFGEGADGELYVLDYGRGEIRRLVFSDDGDNVPELLSQTGCLNTASGGAPPLLDLVPYGLNAPFWSDDATKERWMGLPNGENIAVLAEGDWDLPNGTVIVKHFRLGARLLETRLFMRHPDGVWAGYTYQWNGEQTEATRVHGGLIAAVGGQDWYFPSEAECMFCHNEAAGFTLGLETAQLNGPHSYPQTGRTANQIATLNGINALTPPIGADPPALADPADANEPLETRARSYLHVNCSICHRPQGPTPATMDLRHDTPLAQTGACDVPPTLGDLGIPDARIIAPGDPARSELLARMSRRDASGMPPIASLRPDTEGAALISAWIESLTAASCR